MIKNFESLSSEEIEKLRLGISWIAVLIAGADGKIDSTEVSWASKIAKIRSFSSPKELNEFYENVYTDFGEKLPEIIENTPNDTKARTEIAVNKLAELNPILAKLPNSIGAMTYKSLVSFATHVAKASGGFLRIWSISHEEGKYINLPMLDEITAIEE